MSEPKDRPCLFLSHSSKDKTAVKRLNRDLKRAGFDTWFDEDHIGVGDRIPKKIQDGLLKSSYVCIWLTKFSVSSGWVEKEWSPAIVKEVENNKTIVLPLLAEDCEIPPFLLDKRFADFRDDYERGFGELLVTVKGKAGSKKKRRL